MITVHQWKWNESGFMPILCTYMLNWARRTWPEVWWVGWHCPPNTGFEIQTLEVWGRARLPLGHGGSPQYWVLGVDGEETFCFFQTADTGNRTLARKAAVLTTTLGPPHERKHIVHPVEIYASRFNLHSTRPPLTWYKHVKWNHSLMYYNCTPPPPEI